VHFTRRDILSNPLWKPCDPLIDSAGRYLAARTEEMGRVLNEYQKQLKPLEDPLLRDKGFNREGKEVETRTPTWN